MNLFRSIPKSASVGEENGIECLSGEGPGRNISSNCLTKSYNFLLRALSKCLLDTDRLGALRASLERLFQCLTTLTVKKGFLAAFCWICWLS